MKPSPQIKLITLVIVSWILSSCSTIPLLEKAPETRFIESAKVSKLLTEQPAKEATKQNELIAFFADPDEGKMIRGITGREGYQSVFESEIKVVDLPLLRAYLEGILEKLLTQWPGPRPEPAIQLKLMVSDMPNAFATEFNEIVVSLGLIKQSESEDDIAGMLGHELAHILLKHFERQNLFRSQRHVTSALKNLAITTAQVENTRLRYDDDDIKVETKNQEKIKNKTIESTATSMLIDEVASSVFSSFWSRKQENNADLLGKL